MTTLLRNITTLGQLALLYLAATAAYGANQLPRTIPTHYGANGLPNQFGSRNMIWIVPIAGLCLVLFLTLIERFPQLFNYPVPVTEENEAELRSLSLSLLAWLRAEIICLLAVVEWGIIASARAGHSLMPIAYFYLAMAIILTTIALHVIGMLRAK